MSRLDRLRTEFDEDVIEIADNVLDGIPLSSIQLRAAFSKEELKEMNRMLEEVRAATGENEKAGRLTNHALTALKLLQKLGVVL